VHKKVAIIIMEILLLLEVDGFALSVCYKYKGGEEEVVSGYFLLDRMEGRNRMNKYFYDKLSNNSEPGSFF